MTWVTGGQHRVQRLNDLWTDLSFQDCLGFLLRFLEVVNTSWLMSVLGSQTLGSYNVRAKNTNLGLLKVNAMIEM